MHSLDSKTPFKHKQNVITCGISSLKSIFDKDQSNKYQFIISVLLSKRVLELSKIAANIIKRAYNWINKREIIIQRTLKTAIRVKIKIHNHIYILIYFLKYKECLICSNHKFYKWR